MALSLKDKILTPSTGLITGVIAWRLTVFLEFPNLYGFSYAWLIVLLPIIWVAVLLLGVVISRKLPFFFQFSRFGIIGATNAFIDFGYLNILIAYTGVHSGVWFAIFKGASFVVATINSYFLNKYWAFNAGHHKPNGTELGRFLAISLSAMVINISAASIIVNLVAPINSVSPALWANAGAVTGSIAALVFNFLGYKFIVFKTEK